MPWLTIVAVGLTSRYFVIPVSEHQDTVGPMARTVKDSARILQAIAGPDPHDNYTSLIANTTLPDYVSACKMDGLSGIRLGIPRNVIAVRSENFTGPMVDAFNQSLRVLEDSGAVIVDNTDFPTAAEFHSSKLPTKILNADFIVNLHTYLSSFSYNPNNITSLATLRKFTQSFPLEAYPLRDTGLWDQALQNWNNTDPRFWPAYQQNLYYGDEGGLLGTLKRYQLDAVILPTRFAASSAATVGAPIVTVPLGFYPASAPVVRDSWGLVTAAPGTPYVVIIQRLTFVLLELILFI